MQAITKDEASRMTDAQLADYAWAKVGLAWLGSSVGFVLFLAAMLWRWGHRQPHLLIEYYDGLTVWSYSGELIRGARPDVPMQDNLLWALAVMLAIAVVMTSTQSWRRAISEQRRRHSEKLRISLVTTSDQSKR